MGLLFNELVAKVKRELQPQPFVQRNCRKMVIRDFRNSPQNLVHNRLSAGADDLSHEPRWLIRQGEKAGRWR
jgi:hypothetical protein